MNISQQQQNLIDAYLRNELSEEMRQSFEAALATNEVLKKEFTFQQSLSEAADLVSVKEAMEQARVDNLVDNKTAYPQFEVLKNNIEEARTSNIKHYRRQRIKRWLIAGVAAASIILASFGGWKIHLKKEVEQELANIDVLFSFELTDIQTVGARQDKIEHELKNAKKAYEAEDFDEVANILTKLREQSDYQSDRLIYYETIMYARTGNYTKSIKLLNELIQKESDIEHDARWYAALVYLKTNEKDKAKEQFNILVQNSEKYKAQANRKLQKHYSL